MFSDDEVPTTRRYPKTLQKVERMSNPPIKLASFGKFESSFKKSNTISPYHNQGVQNNGVTRFRPLSVVLT